MEFKNIITAGILHEMSETAKKRLRIFGKTGIGTAGAGALGYGAAKKLIEKNPVDTSKTAAEIQRQARQGINDLMQKYEEIK